MANRAEPTTTLTRGYPPPPWTLWGSALAASFLVQSSAVEGLVPPPLKLLKLPGSRAFGQLAIARYGAGSTLEYSELIATVLVRYGVRIASYVTHIAVDNSRSQRGGHEIWHLPKQFWRFEWNLEPPEAGVRVWDGARLVCAINRAPLNARFWPIRTRLPVLVPTDEGVSLLSSEIDARFARVAWQLQPGPDGPLAGFKPAGRLLTTAMKGRLHIPALQPL